MAWIWISVCFLAVLSCVVASGEEGQTPSWISDNLQGKMFSVMKGGDVRFRSDNPSNITGLTVCLRVLTEQTSYSIKLSFGNKPEAVKLDGLGNNFHSLSVSGINVRFDWFYSVETFPQLGLWKSRCFTWDSSSGMAQLWLDGKMSVRKGVARGQEFSGPTELSLYPFEGQLSDVYIWDRALTVRELHSYLCYNGDFQSSILNWQGIQYSTRGYTVLEPTLVSPYN